MTSVRTLVHASGRNDAMKGSRLTQRAIVFKRASDAASRGTVAAMGAASSLARNASSLPVATIGATCLIAMPSVLTLAATATLTAMVATTAITSGRKMCQEAAMTAVSTVVAVRTGKTACHGCMFTTPGRASHHTS